VAFIFDTADLRLGSNSVTLLITLLDAMNAFLLKPKTFRHSWFVHNLSLRQLLLLLQFSNEIFLYQFLFCLKEGPILLVLGWLLPGALMTFHNGKLQPTKSLNLTFKTYVVRAHVLLSMPSAPGLSR